MFLVWWWGWGRRWVSLEGFQIFCPNKHSDVQLGQHTWNVHLGQQHTGRTFQVQIQVERTMMRTWDALNKDEKVKMSIMRLAIVEIKVKAAMWLYWRHSCNHVYFGKKINNHFFGKNEAIDIEAMTSLSDLIHLRLKLLWLWLHIVAVGGKLRFRRLPRPSLEKALQPPTNAIAIWICFDCRQDLCLRRFSISKATLLRLVSCGSDRSERSLFD